MFPELPRELFQAYSCTTALRSIGTIYTRSREVFDYFYDLKPFNYLFSEMKTEIENEIYDIYTIDLEKLARCSQIQPRNFHSGEGAG